MGGLHSSWKRILLSPGPCSSCTSLGLVSSCSSSSQRLGSGSCISCQTNILTLKNMRRQFDIYGWCHLREKLWLRKKMMTTLEEIYVGFLLASRLLLILCDIWIMKFAKHIVRKKGNSWSLGYKLVFFSSSYIAFLMLIIRAYCPPKKLLILDSYVVRVNTNTNLGETNLTLMMPQYKWSWN